MSVHCVVHLKRSVNCSWKKRQLWILEGRALTIRLWHSCLLSGAQWAILFLFVAWAICHYCSPEWWWCFQFKNWISQDFCVDLNVATEISCVYNWIQKSTTVFKVKNFFRQLWFNFPNEPISDKKTNSRLFVPQPTSWVHTSRYCSCLERFFCMNSYHHSVFHSSGKPWQESFFQLYRTQL